MHASALIAAAILTAGQVVIPSVSVDPEFLMAGDKAYFMGSAKPIAGGQEIGYFWSSDGKFLIAMTAQLADRDVLALLRDVPIEPTRSLVVYDVARESVKTLKIAKGEHLLPYGLAGGTAPCLVFSVKRVIPSGPNRDEPGIVTSLWRWRLDRPAADEVGPINDLTQVTVSESLPFGIVGEVEPETMRVSSAQIFTTTGVPRPISLPKPGGLFYAAGKKILYSVTERLAPRDFRVLYWDVKADGTMTPVPTATAEALISAERPVPMDPNGIQLAQSRSGAKHGGNETNFVSAWLWMPDKGQIRATLVAADSQQFSLSPTKDAVGYVSQGNLMVRRILPSSRHEVERVLEAKEQKEIMSRAKQVGTAMHIYATDYDDQLPLEAGWQDAVLPYLKNQALMEGFEFALPGRNLSKVDDPHETVLGHINGKNGRAVVYADGSVRWERRKRP